jgi:DNA polymerase-3 subunit alpha (Gram-positive type)
MIAAGVPDWYIGSCKKIKYLFPKAHAVAYCMMAFRIAWFKVYHPLAFYAAYFYRRSQKGGFDANLMMGGMESVRKGKGLPDGAEEEMRAAGVPEWYIGSCKKIKYLFPKAHAVAYCMMAFRIAWFKVYHPLAFYAAYFYRRSQKGGFDAGLMTSGLESVLANIKAIDDNADATAKDEDLLTTLEVVYEFYLRGLEFLPVDLYKSHATKFLIEDGKLRPPFVAMSGLGESAAWDLMEGREGKTFLSVEEVSAACPKVSKTHIQMLKDAGAFGDMPETNQVSLF